MHVCVGYSRIGFYALTTTVNTNLFLLNVLVLQKLLYKPVCVLRQAAVTEFHHLRISLLLYVPHGSSRINAMIARVNRSCAEGMCGGYLDSWQLGGTAITRDDL
jgi:hypothetical protein